MKRKFDNQNEEYPIVLVPDKILSNITSGVKKYLLEEKLKDLPKPHKSYISEIIKSPNRPNKYDNVLRKRWKLNWYGILSVTIFFIGILGFYTYFKFEDNWHGIFRLLVFFVSLFMAGLGYLGMIKNSYPNLFYEQFEERVEVQIHTNEEYDLLMNKYLEEEKEYNRKVKKINKSITAENEINQKKYDKELENARKEAIEEIHLSDLRPVKLAQLIPGDKKRGKTDLYLLDYALKKYKGDRISEFLFADRSIPNNNYRPDLLWICLSTDLHIDIEIDEPYTYKNDPIHFIGCPDNERDLYFIGQNWVVVRFSEKQVFTQPDECLQTIDSIHYSMINRIDQYMCYVKTEKRWSYEEALVMAHNNYRSKYLSGNV